MDAIHHVYKNHDSVTFLTGEKNILLLNYGSFLYKRINGHFPKTTWRCNKGCSATVHTFNGYFQKASPLNYHTHPPLIDDISVIETKIRIKTRIETEFGLSPRQIHTEERTKLLLRDQQGAHLQMDSYSKSRSNLYKYRQANFPKAPIQRADVEFPEQWKLTLDKSETFLLVDDGTDDKILIFGTESNLRILCTAEYVVSDGTFSIHPKIFSQLYIFHAPYLGKTLPLLFCLLPDKSYNTYHRLLNLIKNAARLIGVSFEPRKIHIDYEMSMISAVSVVFSKDTVQGCLFHYNQCIWRKVRELGMATAYKKYRHVRQWIRGFSALPFLPVCDIDNGFIEIHENSPNPSNDSVSQDQIERFNDYMLNTWIHDTDAKFDRNLWNHHENIGPRTTNNAEGWNNRLNQQAKTHLSFFQFVHFVQGIQVDIDATKFDLVSQSPTTQAAKYRNINETINVAKKNYATGNVPILTFLDSASVALKLD